MDRPGVQEVLADRVADQRGAVVVAPEGLLRAPAAGPVGQPVDRRVDRRVERVSRVVVDHRKVVRNVPRGRADPNNTRPWSPQSGVIRLRGHGRLG